jgi:crotonobetainyl-CoA:carnitine CoA-transferase CaiB-like acyl-CoA transferase
MKARGFFVEIDHPEAGRLSYPSGLAKFSCSPIVFERPAPLLGQHNQEIYCERLGYSPHELSRLRETGII